MKLLSAQQMQLWDAYTIAQEPIASIDLMERAAKACADWLTANMPIDAAVKIFCGKGNNGGDGLAMARLLIAQDMQVAVYILEFGAIGTADFQTNLQRLHLLTKEINFIQSAEYFPTINKGDIVVDALYGSGLNRPLENLSKDLVKHINQYALYTIAIDVPSGMYIAKGCKDGTVIQARHTLTFQALKLCLLAAENAVFFGQVQVLDIGLHLGFINEVETNLQAVYKAQVAPLVKPRNAFAHKSSFGHALLVAGDKGKMGAAILSARACLRSGVGLLTVNVFDDGLNIVQTIVPEAMCMIRGEEYIDWQKYASLGIGPGLGTAIASQQLVKTALVKCKAPVVIDADALNCIAMNQEENWLGLIPQNAVLTPHPKEFDRLFGEHKDAFERWDKALALSQQYKFVIVLKGHHTFIAQQGKGWFNTTGNVGMAKGGSGDVLTGIITALLAQQYTNLDAALVGVYLHGLAGDIALQNHAAESMLPSDLIDCIGKGFLTLRGTV